MTTSDKERHAELRAKCPWVYAMLDLRNGEG
jgi:hypothetical protein